MSRTWTLPHVRDPCFGEQEWYYFVEKNPSGHKSLSEEGTVPTTHGWRKHPLEEIIKDNDGDGEEEEGTIIGLKSKFHFYLYNGSDKPRTPTSTSSWSQRNGLFATLRIPIGTMISKSQGMVVWSILR